MDAPTTQAANYRVHKVALRPTPEQVAKFERHAAYARLAYNWGVEQFRAALDEYKAWVASGSEPETRPRWPSGYDLCKRFNQVKDERIPWGGSCYQSTGKQAMKDVGAAIKAYGAGRKAGREVGIPRFKKRGAPRAFRADNGKGVVAAEGMRLTVPAKIGGSSRTIRLHERIRWEGPAVECTILKEGKRWYAAVVLEAPAAPARALRQGETLGIDLGLKSLVVCSDETVYENPRHLYESLAKLRTMQKAVSRRKDGSRRKALMRAEVAELHAQIKRDRMDHFRKVAASIVAKPCERIKLETLNIRGMKRNSKLARSISDAAMGTCALVIEEAAKAAGIVVERIDQWYPSTQLCSACGSRANMTLSMRTYRCQDCGLVIDRDANAAKNIASAPAKGAAA